MRLFRCRVCQQLLHFENTFCTNCGHALGFCPADLGLHPLDEQGTVVIRDQKWTLCANAAHGACNWLVNEADEGEYCPACALNRTVPDLSQPELLQRWQRIELAKHRMVYGLLRFGLPLNPKLDDDDTRGLAFDFLAEPDAQFRDSPKVMTGHAQGLITLNLAEADDAERERQRLQMAEPYRTLLGHLRHEVGHYYWEVLVRDNPEELSAFRTLFGDERLDYSEALERHYEHPVLDWQSHYVSAYASAHPWEDWAESWAHCLHMIDTLETAYAWRMSVEPAVARNEALDADADFDPYLCADFGRIARAWLPLTVAVNSLNRSMGQPDLYPFALTETALNKISHIHGLIRRAAGR